jgi:hypothetical protein
MIYGLAYRLLNPLGSLGSKWAAGTFILLYSRPLPDSIKVERDVTDEQRGRRTIFNLTSGPRPVSCFSALFARPISNPDMSAWLTIPARRPNKTEVHVQEDNELSRVAYGKPIRQDQRFLVASDTVYISIRFFIGFQVSTLRRVYNVSAEAAFRCQCQRTRRLPRMY